jgi:hypothetical protein
MLSYQIPLQHMRLGIEYPFLLVQDPLSDQLVTLNVRVREAFLGLPVTHEDRHLIGLQNFPSASLPPG